LAGSRAYSARAGITALRFFSGLFAPIEAPRWLGHFALGSNHGGAYMKILMTILGLSMACGVTAAEETAASPAKLDCEKQTQTTDVQQMRCKELIGSAVQTKDAAGMGEIQDIVFDLNTGKIQFAVVGKRDGIGLSSTMVPVPWKAISLQAQKQYIVNVDREKLGSVPPFTDDVDFAQPDYILHIYQFYQLQPLDEAVGAPGFDSDKEGASGSSRDRHEKEDN
jgi:sporulation protein YlmC with PRC-barrel domain